VLISFLQVSSQIG